MSDTAAPPAHYWRVGALLALHRSLRRSTTASASEAEAPQPRARPAREPHRPGFRRSGELRRAARARDHPEDIGRKLDTALSWKYDDRDPDPDPPGAVRVVLRMRVDKVTGYAA